MNLAGPAKQLQVASWDSLGIGVLEFRVSGCRFGGSVGSQGWQGHAMWILNLKIWMVGMGFRALHG